MCAWMPIPLVPRCVCACVAHCPHVPFGPRVRGRVCIHPIPPPPPSVPDAPPPHTQPEFTGEVFRAVFMLFKYVSGTVVRNMDSVRRFYGPLLGHKKPYVRRFAAVSLAFLMRKIKDRRELRAHVKGLVAALGSLPEPALARLVGAEPAAKRVKVPSTRTRCACVCARVCVFACVCVC
jgi:hypothetical protein